MDERALTVVVLAAVAAYLLTHPAVDENGETDNAPELMDYAAQAADTLKTYIESGDEMNQRAFLAALRLGEGTMDTMGYFRLCGGGNADNLGDHPANGGWRGWPLPRQMAINAGFPGGVAVSTAAGAYQFTRPTWNRLRARLALSDFSEVSQDAAAWALIGEKGAQADVLAGRIDSAIAKLGGVWASLPGAAAKQRQVTSTAFANQYTNMGGNIA